VLLNAPDLGDTLTLRFPESPDVKVIEDGFVLKVKDESSPDPGLLPLLQASRVCTPDEIRLVMLGFPTAWT